MTVNKKIINTDFCVVGAGSGGLSFAAGCVQMGGSVVLLEKGKMGGDCLNYGCVPSKSLIYASKFANEIKKSINVGWNNNKISKVDFKKVHDHIHNVISKIEPHDSVERFESLGVNVIKEEGFFLDENHVETKSYIIKAKRFIISTGSSPFIPNINGLDLVPFYTNENIFDLTELPEHLVVIGGGPIGIELASAFNRLGSKATVLSASKILPKDDVEITSLLKAKLIGEGIDIHENIKINNVSKEGDLCRVDYECEDGNGLEIKSSHLLIATGRKPNITSLNLHKAGINFSEKGICVGKNLKTSNPKVYAIGDCIGGYQFTHVAGYHAGIAIRNSIFHLGAKIQTHAIPWVTYTDPEIAHVGVTEQQISDNNYKILKMNFSDNDRAQTECKTEGMIKVIVTKKGKILGATIFGPSAGELIYPWVIAMQNNMNISVIASSIAPYPTLSEINKRVAGQFYTEKLYGSFMNKIVKFIMRL